MWDMVNFRAEFNKFSFPSTGFPIMAKESSLPNYLPTTGERIVGFIPFPRVLSLCDMQTASSKIRTRVTDSISYDDNQYTTSTSKIIWFLRISKIYNLDTKIYPFQLFESLYDMF